MKLKIKDFLVLIDNCAKLSKNKDKMDLINLFPNIQDWKDVLTKMFMPSFKFGLQTKLLAKLIKIEAINSKFDELLSIMLDSSIESDEKLRQIKLINNLSITSDEYDLITHVINKRFKSGLGRSSFADQFNLKPEYKSMSGYALDLNDIKSIDKLWSKDYYWLGSSKIDGERMWVLFDNGQLVDVISPRNGTKISRITTKKILDDLQTYITTNNIMESCFFDGELGFQNTSWEKMRTRAGEWRSSKVIEDALYFLFDLVFDKNVKYIKRIEVLSDYFKKISTSHLEILDTFPIYDTKTLFSTLNSYISKGHEGLMIRKSNSVYTFGKSRDLYKLKPFTDSEFTVTKVNYGDYVDSSTKLKVPNVVTALSITGKHPDIDNEIVQSNVGGLKRDEIYVFTKDPDSIIGKIVTIKYQKITKERDSVIYSLQHPSYIGIRYEDEDLKK